MSKMHCGFEGRRESPGNYLRYLESEPGNISFGMGRHGAPSRVMSPLLGGAYTYASASAGKESAPGQLTLWEMRLIYRAMGV